MKIEHLIERKILNYLEVRSNHGKLAENEIIGNLPSAGFIPDLSGRGMNTARNDLEQG